MNFHYGAADEGGSSAAAAQKRRAEGARIPSHDFVRERLWDDGWPCVLTVVDPFTSRWAKR